MISVVRAAELCEAIYADASTEFQLVLSTKGVFFGLGQEPDGTRTVTFRGSRTPGDWLRDFEAVPYGHKDLGTLHAGFWEGMEEAAESIQAHIGQNPTEPVSIQGHSLGCPHASIYAGLRIVSQLPVAQLTLFAPPRASYRTLPDLLQSGVGVIRAFRNGSFPFEDPVPAVPLALPGFPWCDLAPLEKVTRRPKDWWDGLAYHSMSLYSGGVRELEEGASAGTPDSSGTPTP